MTSTPVGKFLDTLFKASKECQENGVTVKKHSDSQSIPGFFEKLRAAVERMSSFRKQFESALNGSKSYYGNLFELIKGSKGLGVEYLLQMQRGKDLKLGEAGQPYSELKGRIQTGRLKVTSKINDVYIAFHFKGAMETIYRANHGFWRPFPKCYTPSNELRSSQFNGKEYRGGNIEPKELVEILTSVYQEAERPKAYQENSSETGKSPRSKRAARRRLSSSEKRRTSMSPSRDRTKSPGREKAILSPRSKTAPELVRPKLNGHPVRSTRSSPALNLGKINSFNDEFDETLEPSRPPPPPISELSQIPEEQPKPGKPGWGYQPIPHLLEESTTSD